MKNSYCTSSILLVFSLTSCGVKEKLNKGWGKITEKVIEG